MNLYGRMLHDLEAGVDRTDTKLSGAMQRMKKFIRQTEGEYDILGVLHILIHAFFRDKIRVVHYHPDHYTYDSACGRYSILMSDLYSLVDC